MTTERHAFDKTATQAEGPSSPFIPSQVGADLPEQGGLWQIIDTREEFGSYDRVVRTSGGGPKYWSRFEDASEHASLLNGAHGDQPQVFEVFSVEFANDASAGDVLTAEPLIVPCATLWDTEENVLGAIKNHVYDDERPWTAHVTPYFDAEQPDFDSGPVLGVVALGADEGVNAFTVTKLGTITLSARAFLDFDDKLIGTRVAMSPDERDYNTRDARLIGTVIASYTDPLHPESFHTTFLTVLCDDGQVLTRWRRMVHPLQKVEDTRLSLLLKAYASPHATLMGSQDRDVLLSAAVTLNPADDKTEWPLPALHGLQNLLLWGRIDDDMRPVAEKALHRLGELLSAYEEAHPIEGELSEKDVVYRYVMVGAHKFEREIVTVVKCHDDGTVTVTAGNGVFRAEPSQFAGRWPFGAPHADLQNVPF